MPILFLFDIDGTILKFKAPHSKAIFIKLIKDIFSKEVDESSLPSFAGMTDMQILKDVAQKIDVPYDSIKRRMPEIWEIMLEEFRMFCNKDNIEVMPGIMKLIPALSANPEAKLGLLTGNFKENAYLKLCSYGLDKYFKFGAFGSDHEDRNRLPMLAISRANEYFGDNIFSHENTIIIGDSPRDTECARVNNITCISVATGFSTLDELTLEYSDVLFKDFSEFEEDPERFYEIAKELLREKY